MFHQDMCRAVGLLSEYKALCRQVKEMSLERLKEGWALSAETRLGLNCCLPYLTGTGQHEDYVKWGGGVEACDGCVGELDFVGGVGG